MALDHAAEKIRVNAVCPGDTFVERWTEKGPLPPFSSLLSPFSFFLSSSIAFVLIYYMRQGILKGRKIQ